MALSKYAPLFAKYLLNTPISKLQSTTCRSECPSEQFGRQWGQAECLRNVWILNFRENSEHLWRLLLGRSHTIGWLRMQRCSKIWRLQTVQTNTLQACLQWRLLFAVSALRRPQRASWKTESEFNPCFPKWSERHWIHRGKHGCQSNGELFAKNEEEIT